MTNQNGNFLEDFSFGQKIDHALPRTFTEGDTSLYLGLTGDRFPLFCAETFAKCLGYPSTPVNDYLLFHTAFGRTVHDISLNAVANLGYAEVNFHHPVWVGDTIISQSEVIGIKENSNKSTGIVYVYSSSYNQNNERVLSWKRWVMVPKRDKSAKISQAVPKNIAKEVVIDQMHIPNYLKTEAFNFKATGSSQTWEDYHVGDEINHTRGLTVDESTHTLATHLYQNDAKLHFNAHQMKDTPFKKRLVYGGHIISLCRAISFDGLENSIFTTAIHAGTHCNPTFAGDTIYAKTIVVAKEKIADRNDIGVLKLKMIGLKNKQPDTLHSIFQNGIENKIYDPNVVLDLDYSVVLPTGR